MRWIKWLRVAVADALTGGHGADIPDLSIRFRLPRGWAALVPAATPWAALVRRSETDSPDAPPVTLENLDEMARATFNRALEDALGKPRPGDLVVMLAAGLGDGIAAAEEAQRRHGASTAGRRLERLDRVRIGSETCLAVTIRDLASGALDATWARPEGRLWWLVATRLPGGEPTPELEEVAHGVLGSAAHRGGDLDRFTPDDAGRLRLHQAGASVQVPAGWTHRMIGGSHRLEPGTRGQAVLVIDDGNDAPAPFGHILYPSPPWPDASAVEYGPLADWQHPGHDGPAWVRLLTVDRPSGQVQVLEVELSCPRGWPLLSAIGTAQDRREDLEALLRQVAVTASGPIPPRPHAAACVAAVNQALPLIIGREAPRPPPPRSPPAIPVATARVITTLAAARDLRAGLRLARRRANAGAIAVLRHHLLPDPVWAIVPLAPGDGSVLLRTQSGPWWTPAEGLGPLVELLPRDPDDGMILLDSWPEMLERLPVARLPPPLSAHGLPGECAGAASSMLMRVSNAEHAFARSSRRPAGGHDGPGAFATLDELCGPVGCDLPAAARLDTDLTREGVAGYRFRVHLPDGQGGALSTRRGSETCPEQAEAYVCYAWPAGLPPGSAPQYAVAANLEILEGPASADEPPWWALWGDPAAAWGDVLAWS